MMPPEPSALREAAQWFARMRGPDAASSREAFERWLAAGEANRKAYSRVAETFSLGKHLAEPCTDDVGERRRVRRPVLLCAIAAAAVALAGVSLVSLRHETKPSGVAANDRRSLATRTGEIRSMALADGSRITLDTGTELVAIMSVARRDIRMIRGRARFDVAHDGRPFIVHVADGAIVARGTVFDVRISGRRTQVQLLRGAIDVERTGKSDRREVRRLVPGQAVTFSAAEKITSPTTPDRSQILQPGWPDALLAFDRVTLGELATEANRYSTTRLLVEPDLAAIPVSGTFRVGDPQRLAERLAALLGVDAVHRPGGDIDLKSRPYGMATPATTGDR